MHRLKIISRMVKSNTYIIKKCMKYYLFLDNRFKFVYYKLGGFFFQSLDSKEKKWNLFCFILFFPGMEGFVIKNPQQMVRN